MKTYKRTKLLSLFISLIFVLSFFALSAFADSGRVVDLPSFLSEKEKAEIEEKIAEIEEKHGVFVMIYFTKDKYPSDIDIDALNVRMYRDSGKILRESTNNSDAILYFLSLDGGYRDYFFYRTGKCLDALEDGREVDYLKECAEEYMTRNDFYSAALEFLSVTDTALERENAGESIISRWDILFDSLPIILIVSAVIALIAVLIMRSGMKSVKEERDADVYSLRDSFNLTRASDIFLYRTVSRRPRPKSTSSGGGSRGGGGGRGGGGRC